MMVVLRTYTQSHMHTYAYTHTHVHSHIHSRTLTRTHSHTLTRTHSHTLTHTLTRTHTHIHAHTYMHSHIHTHTQVGGIAGQHIESEYHPFVMFVAHIPSSPSQHTTQPRRYHLCTRICELQWVVWLKGQCVSA